ncbi:hypothetical protein D1AOALGA4SA_9399 [Olavius algarvensis Delta 1 endosymbiont]|nr:hypothetical protein D1AOALGA4SA_9399 [Olavius algarvensis Delta 1 endosymbiont]
MNFRCEHEYDDENDLNTQFWSCYRCFKRVRPSAKGQPV